MSKEYVGAIAILAVMIFKAFGIEIESGVIEGIVVGVVALIIAISRYKKGNITVLGARKVRSALIV